MIAGVGVDLVEITRIRHSLERFGERFARKILSSDELVRFADRPDQSAWLAKRFAAKEAVAKALGTGMRAGVHFCQIEVSSKRSGAPVVTLSGAAEARANKLEVTNIHISISDEREHAIAFVVLEG